MKCISAVIQDKTVLHTDTQHDSLYLSALIEVLQKKGEHPKPLLSYHHSERVCKRLSQIKMNVLLKSFEKT